MTEQDLSQFDLSQLEGMHNAGKQVLNCYRVLLKSKANVVGELISGAGEFYERDHYPKGDVYDNDTHSQYYYHAHPSENRINQVGAEHGHFHTFVRPRGMPKGVKPLALPDYKKPAARNDDICHLVGISMDRRGQPIRLFTVNRWVTGDTWYAGEDVIKTLDYFNIDQSWPSWPVNIWLTSMLQLFKSDVEALIIERDKALKEHQITHPDINAYEDRSLEVTSFMDINVNDKIKLIAQEIKQRNID